MKLRNVPVLLMITLWAMLTPRVGDAQAPTKVARIGWMSRGNPTASDADMDAFRQGMRDLGYTEGQAFVMEPRYAGGKRELLPEQAAELERAGVDVIIAGPFQALQAAKESTSRVPIIMKETQATARTLGVRLQVVEAARVEDFDAVFSAMAQERAEALVVLVNPMFSVERQHILERAAKQGLPAIYEWRSFVRGGGLISYGADVSDVYRRAAGFVDKILKGAKPGDLRVEGPTRVDMAVNLKAAKALGVRIPESIVKQAVEVIE